MTFNYAKVLLGLAVQRYGKKAKVRRIILGGGTVHVKVKGGHRGAKTEVLSFNRDRA